MIFSLEFDTNPYDKVWAGLKLWDPTINDPRTYNVHDIELKKQINQASSLTFSIGPQHPFYSEFDPRGCMGISIGLRMGDSNQFLFYGRVVSVDTDIWHIKKISCEGAYAFFNDIMLRPVSFSKSGDKSGYYSITQYGDDTLSWADYAYYVFGKFRTRMGTVNSCWKRVVEIGRLDPIPYRSDSDPTAVRRYSGVDDYTPVADAVADIIGADNRMMARLETLEDENTHEIVTTMYVDTIGRINKDAIFSLDFNLINVSESGNGLDVYTAIIPLAKNKTCIDVRITTSDPEMHISENTMDGDTLYVAQDVMTDTGGAWANANGYIEKVVEFNDIEIKPDHYSGKDEGGHYDVDTQARTILTKRATEVLAQHGSTGIREFSVSGVDLALLYCAGKEPFTSNTVHHLDEETGKPVYLSDLLDENDFIDVGDRVYFSNTEYKIKESDHWVCTSLSMSIDDQAETSYTFSIIDENYVPADNTLLAQQKWSSVERYKKKEAAANGTTVHGEVQPTNVIKVDANHVVEMYPDREIHYVADGEGDVRTNIRSYVMPINTTDPENPHPETTTTGTGS